MLTFEKKKTDKVDLIKPLTKYIKEQFSKEELASHETVISNLNAQRESIRNLQDITETSKEMVWKYYSVLSSLESRFPISESNVRISFPWTDTYKQRKNSLYSIYFERGSVLFNYSSIVGSIGATQSRATVEGVKKACNSFQQSAGALQTLREYISAHPECFAAPDFSSDSLQMLQTLMLSQAQECVYEKAAMDNLSGSIQAKVALQVSEYYDNVLTLLNGNTLKNLVDRNWSFIVQVKSAVYKAIAQYKHSVDLEPKFLFGEIISRMSVAIEAMTQAKANLPRNASPELKDLVEKTQTAVQKYFEYAKKDNDTIYHESVIPIHNLVPLEKKVLVKPLPLAELSFSDPFASLIPFSVKEDAAYYNDEKEKLKKRELDNIENQNQIAKGMLISMGLPGSIEAQEMGIPKALQEKMDLVRSEKGTSNISSLLENLSQLGQEDQKICEVSSQILKKEEDEDNEMRTKYQSAWHRTPSYTLTANFNQDLAKYNTHLSHSTKSDGFIRKKFDENKHLIAALENQQEVLSLLPSNLSSVNQIPEIASLTILLNDLDSLMASREKLTERFKDQIKKDDITIKLLNPMKDKQQIYAEEIKKYEPIQLQLNESFLKQESLLKQIQKENEKFTNGKSKHHGNQREEVVQRFANAFKIYNELKSNLDEGIQFYANFQEILVKFQNKCKDFVKEREQERLELLRQITTGTNPYNSPIQQQNIQHQQPPPTYQPQTPPNYFSNNVMQPPRQQHQQPPPTYQPQPVPFIFGNQQQQQPPMYHQQNPNFPTSFQAPPPPYAINKNPPYYK